MNGYQLGQTLVIPEETSLETIASVLRSLGFEQAGTRAETAPFIEGETEIVDWTYGGQLPIVQYRFNPVVRLRTLDVATVPPELRARIAEALKPLSAEALRACLDSPEPRTKLYGLWAAVETERLDLSAKIEEMCECEKGLLREEACSARDFLANLASARAQVLLGARLVANAAMTFLQDLEGPAAIRKLAPSEADCHRLFDPLIAERIAEGARHILEKNTRPIGKPARAEDITACPAGALRWPNELSDKFPAGYRRIAGWMQPDCVWLAWTGTEPDGGTRRYDGLSFVEGHWVLIPKAHKLVSPLVMAAEVESRGRTRH